MNEIDFEAALKGITEQIAAFDENDMEDIGLPEALPLIGAEIRTFEQASLLTRNRGLVVRLRNGDEFQVTIVQSARGRGEEP